MKGRVLIVAGSDSSGGAGIQADIKAVTALNGYAMTAICALTAQNTQGVFGIVDIEPDFVARQMALALDDIGADCIKTGMVSQAAVIDTIVATLDEKAPDVPLVVDPVMVAKGGAALLHESAARALRDKLVARATVVTPNIPEAEALTGLSVADNGEEAVARALRALGPRAVLLKGGHASGDTVRDLLVSADGTEVFESPRLDTPHTHGTGCTLASAIAAGLGQGLSLRDAVARARAYVLEAIRTAPGYGHGHGPLNHAHTVRPFEGT
jgi:hydroxymethylpyrimidine/phosphomethylpyrimidine kinase